MNVLSLFDGMSCGQLALQRAGIKYDAYYASEVDKHAVKVTQHHFPATVQLGDVRNVKGADLPKIDLLIGGSPCKGFSQAGDGLNFEHPESKLFFEYVRISNEVKPTYWLLENVKMRKAWEQIINKILKTRPLRFNSSWVSAQLRERLYWTNIPVNNIPKDKKIVLSDIIEDGAVWRDKAYCLDSSYYKGGSKSNLIKEKRKPSQADRRNMVVDLTATVKPGEHKIFQRARGKNQGGLKESGKTPTMSSSSWEHNNLLVTEDNIRKLTVKECCRLQTVPDNYFEGVVSDTQAYKQLGNGWTIDMIAFILSFIKPTT